MDIAIKKLYRTYSIYYNTGLLQISEKDDLFKII